MAQPHHQDFVRLLSEHQQLVHKVCRAYCPHPEDQRDLFQEIALQLWRAYPHFRGEAKVSTWMYRIALNVALSQVRRSRPPTSVLSPQLHHLHDDPPQQDHLEPLYAAMQMLSDVEKALLLLYFEDNSTEQIADLTGITPNHVRVKLHRIREKLKHHLSHHLSHP